MEKTEKDRSEVELEQDLREMLVQNNEYLKRINVLKDENYELKVNSYSLLKEVKKAKQTFEQNLNEKNHLMNQLIEEKKAFQQLNDKYRNQAKQSLARAERLELEIVNLRNSTSFRLGQVFVKAFARPGKNTFLMPFRFCRLVFQMVATRKQDTEKS
ncbi:MAG: hypothetical protein R6U13_07680 [Desulfatiglandaceae bacterium]